MGPILNNEDVSDGIREAMRRTELELALLMFRFFYL
jgi:hypothetical protein